MDVRYDDRVAIVTGASSGIGRATALRLARDGCHIVAVGRDHDALDVLCREIRGSGGVAVPAIFSRKLPTPRTLPFVRVPLRVRGLALLREIGARGGVFRVTDGFVDRIGLNDGFKRFSQSAAGADIVLLDNFSLADLRTALPWLRGRAWSEVSGGVNLATTNYPEKLDRRIISRPRRFDRILRIDAPDARRREAYIAQKVPELTAAELHLTTDPGALSQTDFHIVTVPTPIDDANRPDLGPLLAASRTVGHHLKRGDIVVGVGGDVTPTLPEFYRKLWSTGNAGVTVPLDVKQAGSTRRVDVPSVNRLDHLKLRSTF